MTAHWRMRGMSMDLATACLMFKLRPVEGHARAQITMSGAGVDIDIYITGKLGRRETTWHTRTESCAEAIERLIQMYVHNDP